MGDAVNVNPDSTSPSFWRRWALRYGLAVVAVAAGFGLRLAFEAWVGPGLPTYVTFYPAVMVAALLAGFGPGLVATALTALTVAYWILPPEGFAIASPVERLGLVLFTGMGLFMSVVAELYRRNRRKAAAYARGLLEASLDPLVTINAEGKITDVNEASVEATGVPREKLIGTDFSNYFTEPHKAREGYRRVFAEGFVRDYPLAIRHVSGRIADVLYNATVYRNEAGGVQGVFAAARDITERKQAEAELEKHRHHLEKLVKQRTAELEAANVQLQAEAAVRKSAEEALRRTAEGLALSNQELEQFAYVASHDLQEPLRAVAGYLSLIEARLRDKLDDKSQGHLNGAVEGAARMHALITDLLALSRVGTHGKAFEPTDLNTVLDRALQSVSASVQEAGAKITRDSLPTLRADASQMAQLFQNLLGNAVKFRGDRPPEIHISAQRQADDQWLFAVRDNGIGIEPQYFQRIFLVFQRLHTRKEYPGTGIGLAICKKIVERHGGRIWVESQPGQGSTFYFTIPNKGTP